MAMTAGLGKALDHQIAREFSAACTCLGMTADFEGSDLDGFAHWMQAQNSE